MTWKMGAIPAARLYHTQYRELPPPPPPDGRNITGLHRNYEHKR